MSLPFGSSSSFSVGRSARRRLSTVACSLALGLPFGLSLTACGRKPILLSTHLADAGSESAETGAVRLTGRVDVCPEVTFSVTPTDAIPGQPVSVLAAAVDADGDALSYLWTASVGSWLDGARASRDRYSCAGPGRVRISLTVSDGQCAVLRKAEIVCLAAEDAGASPLGFDGASGAADGTIRGTGGASSGTSGLEDGGIGMGRAGTGGVSSDGPQPSGAGGRGGAGPGGQGGASPPATGLGGIAGGGTGPRAGGGAGGNNAPPCVPLDPTKDECSGCTACTARNCVPAQTDCDGLDAEAQVEACRALYTCFRESGCAAADINSCFCGPTADLRACWRGVVAPSGPCARQVERAAESQDPSFIEAHFIDPDLALGRAVNLAGCRIDYCTAPSASGPPVCKL